MTDALQGARATGPRILVVGCRSEDCPPLQRTFSLLRADVVEIADLEALTPPVAAQSFELVVCDLKLLRVEDQQAARQVRAGRPPRAVPTLFLTDSHLAERRVLEGYGPAGMADAVVGPPAPGELLAKATALLELDRGRRGAVRRAVGDGM